MKCTLCGNEVTILVPALVLSEDAVVRTVRTGGPILENLCLPCLKGAIDEEIV